MNTKSLPLLIWFWIFIIPLTFNFWSLDPALYSKFLLLDISLLLTGLMLYTKSEVNIRISRTTSQFMLLYGAYIAISVISLCYLGINKADGWFVWLHLFTLPAFVLLLLLIDSRVRIQRNEVAFVISCLAGASIVIGLAQYIQEINNAGWYLAASDVMRSTFAHKNIFSEVLLLTFPFSLYSGFCTDRGTKLTRVISFFTLVAILMLLSRAVWLGMIAASAVTILLYYLANGKLTLRWYHFFAVLVSVCIAYILFKLFIRHTNTGDYLAYFYNKRDTVTERKHLWSATWQIIRSHPLIGSGLGSWKVLNMRYAIVGLRNYTTFFQQPHNDYLWVLSEQGVLALIAAGAAWILIIYKLIRQIFARPTDLFLYTLLFALAGYGVYANMAFPKERAEHGIILAFVTLFILTSDNDRSVSLSRFSLWPICLMIGIGAWWSGNKMICEMHLRNFFEARGRNDIAEQRIQLAAISPTYYSLDGTATPIDWYRGMLNFSQGNMADALTDFEAAAKANPYHAYSLCNVGTCLNQKGDKAGAEQYFRSALEYSPGFPDAALNLCAIRFNEGKIDSAAMYLGMVKDSTNNLRYVKSLNVVSQVYIRSLLDSLGEDENKTIRIKVMDLSKKSDWQAEILKKAYIYNVPVKKQMLLDMIWSIKNDDHDSVSAAYYKRKFNY